MVCDGAGRYPNGYTTVFSNIPLFFSGRHLLFQKSTLVQMTSSFSFVLGEILSFSSNMKKMWIYRMIFIPCFAANMGVNNTAENIETGINISRDQNNVISFSSVLDIVIIYLTLEKRASCQHTSKLLRVHLNHRTKQKMSQFSVVTQSQVNVRVTSSANSFGTEKRFPKDLTIADFKVGPPIMLWPICVLKERIFD